MMNIVIPMAGRGSRFAKAGYTLPKPLIEIHGRPMIEIVVNNIRPIQEHQFIFLCLQEHLEQYNLENRLKSIAPNCKIVPVSTVTEGAACTVLLAEPIINNDSPLMIANSDQFVDININDYLAAIRDFDGLIMTMKASDPKWSFIQYDSQGFVTLLREKEVISDEATVGIYNYKHGSDFVKYAHRMIQKNVRVNGEFYVAPAYNEMISDYKKIVFYNVGNSMHGLGTPEDLKDFLSSEGFIYG